MKRFFITRCLNRISIAKKLYFTVGIMALLIVTELFTLWFAIHTLSSVRAYVGGEGLWSKAQKDAIYNLQKYYRSRDENDYQAFVYFLKVPLGDHKARLEMLKENPDYNVIREGFLEGRIHPDDIDGIIKLFRRFHSVSYISHAIRIWTDADSIISKIIPLGEGIHDEIGRHVNQEPSKRAAELIGMLAPINQQLTVLEDQFSYTLGEGSRWLENLILKLLFAVALTVEVSGLLLTFFVSRGIARGVTEIVGASRAVAKGDFHVRAKAWSEDEIGTLANSFNKMADDLQKRKDEQGRTADDLKAQKEMYESLVKAQGEMEIGVAVTEEHQIVFANAALCKMYGYSEKEILAMHSFMPLIVEHDRDRVSKRMQQRLSGDSMSDTGETAVMRKDGRLIYIEYSLKQTFLGNKKQTVSVIRDVTERKKAERDLRESEEKFRLLVESVKDYAIFMLDDTGHVVTWNKGAERLKGYTSEEIIGKSYSVFYTEEEKKRNEPLYNLKMAKLNGRHEFEGWRLRKDGSKFYADVVMTALHDDNGNLHGFAKLTRDITERRRAEERLKLSEEQLRAANFQLIEAQRIAHIGNWEWNLETEEINWSDEMYNIYGIDRNNKITFQNFQENIHPEDRDYFNHLIQTTISHPQPFDFQFRVIHPDGSVHTLERRGEVMVNALGKAIKMSGTTQDITEIKKTQQDLEQKTQELMRSNKELEQFAYVASHDLQEPLRTINGYVQLLHDRYQGKLDQDANEFIKFTVDATERMKALINDLLAYSRVTSHPKVLAPVDINRVVQNVVSNFQSRNGNKVDFIINDLPVVKADEVQVAQLFQNLISNAVKFQAKNSPQVTISSRLENHHYLFAVKDNGIGIDPQYKDKIFVLFQRLHNRTEYPGTGIGLAICKKIVELYGGEIWVESNEGQGSTFYFTIKK